LPDAYAEHAGAEKEIKYSERTHLEFVVIFLEVAMLFNKTRVAVVPTKGLLYSCDCVYQGVQFFLAVHVSVLFYKFTVHTATPFIFAMLATAIPSTSAKSVAVTPFTFAMFDQPATASCKSRSSTYADIDLPPEA